MAFFPPKRGATGSARPKTASKWLQNWGSLDEIILNAGRITPKRFCSMIYEKRELLHRNRELIKLDTSIQKGGTIPSNPDISKLGEILKEMEMNQSLEEMIIDANGDVIKATIKINQEFKMKNDFPIFME